VTGRRRRVRLVLKLALLSAVVLASVAIAELAARRVWDVKYNAWLEGQLHGYDQLDRQRSLIVPKPGIDLTVEELRRNLVSHGKTIGLRQFEDLVNELSLADSTPILSVNSLGFRGPEIVVPKPEGVFRIVAIGDSVTWGPPIDEWTYPAVLEQHLAPWVLDECGKRLEVVNAGVPGYNFERVLKRIDEYLAVEPDLVTVYLGWNRTIGRADPRKNQRWYSRSALYRFYYHAIVNRNDTGLTTDYSRGTVHDPADPSLAAYADYDFGDDIRQLNELVDTVRARGIPVTLITLAGLLDWRVTPDPRALEIAYPIASTQNLFAYPLLTRRYNEEIRRVARLRDVDLIDFEGYAYDELDPRSDYFTDSVHMTIRGSTTFGRYLATELQGRLPCP
jgi:lysophospholipase L1-like esterase